MKKILVVFLLAFITTSSLADGYRHERRDYRGYVNRGHSEGPGWVVPLLIGGIIGYEISNTRPDMGPAVVQAPPIPPGVTPQPVYVVQWVYYPECNCYKQEMIQTGWR